MGPRLLHSGLDLPGLKSGLRFLLELPGLPGFRPSGLTGFPFLPGLTGVVGRRRSGVLGRPRYGDLLLSGGGDLPRPGDLLWLKGERVLLADLIGSCGDRL